MIKVLIKSRRSNSLVFEWEGNTTDSQYLELYNLKLPCNFVPGQKDTIELIFSTDTELLKLYNIINKYPLNAYYKRVVFRELKANNRMPAPGQPVTLGKNL